MLEWRSSDKKKKNKIINLARECFPPHLLLLVFFLLNFLLNSLTGLGDDLIVRA